MSTKRNIICIHACDDSCALFLSQMEGRDDVDYYRVLVHREVQDYESKRFMNYFEDFTVLKGT